MREAFVWGLPLVDPSHPATGTTTYTFDADGNQRAVENSSNDVTTSTWDFENQNTQFEQPLGDLYTFIYNGDKQRVEREDGTTTTKFAWDGKNILLETDDADLTK